MAETQTKQDTHTHTHTNIHQTLLWTCVVRAHLQFVNNHYAKFEYKGMKSVWDRLHTHYVIQALQRWCDVIMSKFKNILSNVHKIQGAHVQCVNNHNGKFEYKGMKTAWVTDYTIQALISFWMEKMSKFNSPKNKKIFNKCAHNGRCTSSMYEQPLCNVWILRNENCWNYRLHKPDTILAFWTEKMSKFKTSKKWKKYPRNVHKIGVAHLQGVNNH